MITFIAGLVVGVLGWGIGMSCLTAYQIGVVERKFRKERERLRAYSEFYEEDGSEIRL